ncbi:MAG: type III PLP-dependent enzyme [Rubrivivax sp.]|nr:type III PLP-dependent enzyme [Rubrivivax sp.]
MNAPTEPGAAGTTASLPALPALTQQLLAEGFAVHEGELHIGGLGVRALAALGTPLYVMDQRLLEARYRQLQQVLEGFAEVFYSIKANPQPAVAAAFVRLGAGLEIASGGEFHLALAAGCAPQRMLFAGPGKGQAELELAMAGGIGEVHLESFEEIELCGAIARQLGRPQAVALRINPAAAAQGGAMRMGGKPAAFGFDEEQMGQAVAAVQAQPGLLLEGIHLFAGTQVLQAEVLGQQWRIGLDLARQLAQRLGHPLQRIDLGGGLGIPYHAGQATLDLAALRGLAQELAQSQRQDPWLAPSRVLVEPGRWLSGPAGVYLMRVRAVKESRGQRFVICDGGMHHHLAASGNLGQVIKQDYPLLAATQLWPDLPLSPAQVVGPLCTPLDTLGRQTALPPVQAGDLIAVLQSGAYGLSASPTGFLSHPMPAEVMVCEGEPRVLRAAGQFAAPLVNLAAVG